VTLSNFIFVRLIPEALGTMRLSPQKPFLVMNCAVLQVEKNNHAMNCKIMNSVMLLFVSDLHAQDFCTLHF